MHDLAESIDVREDGRWVNQQPPGHGVLGTVPDTKIAKRAIHTFLDARDGAERPIDDDRMQPLDRVHGSARPLVADDGNFQVDLDTPRFGEIHPCAAQKSRPRLNDQVVRNGHPVARARLLNRVVRDTTRQSWPPRQAQLRMEELASANRRKDEFLAMLSHELRSPLSSICFAVPLLGRQMGDAAAQQRTQALIERQLGRMTQLVDELLDISRINSGRLRLHHERIDLRVIVSNAIETLESAVNERNHRLSTELPDTPVWLQGDPGRLEQVFVNLLANASRYTDAGGELTVWVHAKDGQAVVRIRDSGIGIAPNALPHIFDLFKQGNEADPRSTAGLGVGLAVVRNLVELHGGSVSAASAGAGQGSEFTVRLPTED